MFVCGFKIRTILFVYKEYCAENKTPYNHPLLIVWDQKRFPTEPVISGYMWGTLNGGAVKTIAVDRLERV